MHTDDIINDHATTKIERASSPTNVPSDHDAATLDAARHDPFVSDLLNETDDFSTADNFIDV
jgi:hypothetical protein